MEFYIIRKENPLDMEGAADVAAVFSDKELADSTVEELRRAAEEEYSKTWSSRWRSFAPSYEVETHKVQTSVEEAVKIIWKD